MPVILKLIGVLFLILLNGFFVAVEFAVVASRKTRIVHLAEQGNAEARIVQTWLDSPQHRDLLIAGSQVGVTVASLAVGYLGEDTLASLIEPLLTPLQAQTVQTLQPALVVLPLILSLILVTGLHVVLGEQVPKVATLRGPEQAALYAARPMTVFIRIFYPFIRLLDWLVTVTLRALGMDPADVHHTVYTVDELKQIVQESQETGILEAGEREMIHAVFDFGEMQARQVMVPRTEMVCIDAEASLQDAIQMAVRYPITKFPVYENSPDQIIGILHSKDLLRALARGEAQKATIRGLMREALFVPESAPVNDLLAQLRARRQHIAILLDEFGGTAGLVTLEDLLEEIIGNVQTVFEREEPDIQTLPDGSALINGLTLIEDVNAAFGLDLEDPNYDTIAGYVLGHLGRMAKVGDEVSVDGMRLRVEAMDGLRIARLRLIRPSQETAAGGHG